jgi:threonine dehydratase
MMDIDIGRDNIEAAARRIASDIRRTPLLRIDGGQLGIDGAELWLKLEHLQVGGSFKARGMFNRMRSNAIPAAGVVIASGGNAGIAVACAAKALGVPCDVFVPESSSRAKRDKPHWARTSTSSGPATAMPWPRAWHARPRAARC